ncbi:hypothetical protein [Streptomyces sp. ME19-01-6]|uniref:hypothetical protein n=1 Tax=Streptomyces sp. ME19-01-6 TaxID=3028686 RepID=UPI0029BD522D|nr:hypothetical protein [Streptomyces sp. ME19-01-6]MDX3230590.1 hypothetical protein [Streptomyces sp. ME19-01-6]
MKSTGNEAADRVIAGMWLVTEGIQSRRDVETVLREELADKSPEEIQAIHDAIAKTLPS